MIKSWKSLILLLTLAALATAAAAVEMPVSGVAPGGGAVNMQSGSTTLMDVNGQAAIGDTTVNGTRLQLGMIYGLVVGGGTPEAAPGTVKLYISRNGGIINVTWEAAKYGATPDVYILTGDGSGVYNNASTNWRKLINGQLDATGGTTVNISSGLLTHQGQALGGGTSEAYYKGLLTGIIINDFYIASAEAVGKLNINLKQSSTPATPNVDPGMNFVSVPFSRGNNSIAEVLDPFPFFSNTAVYLQVPGHFNFNKAVLKIPSSVKTWTDATTGNDIGSAFLISPEVSFMINVPSDITITVMGRVPRGTEGRALTMQASDYTFFGNYYPQQFALSGATVNTALKLTGTAAPANNDAIYYQVKPGTGYNFNKALFTGSAWVRGDDITKTIASDIVLKLPYGYMYQSARSSGYSWTR
jgi:hypothetical protein